MAYETIDLYMEVPRLPRGVLASGESSAPVRDRVMAARKLQTDRAGCINARLSGASLQSHCRLGKHEATLVRSAMERLKLSARAYHRILRVARTVADLAGSTRNSGT
jgi:magnesium chelatase family protein